jgi:hypothetical protein
MADVSIESPSVGSPVVGKHIATTGRKHQYNIQSEEKKIIEPDDIQCDLDEDLDDEHYSSKVQEPANCENRKTGVNDSFIS